VWEVEYTDEFGRWWGSLQPEEQDRVAAAVELLEVAGPSLGRPMVDTIKASKHPNMKELRPGSMRVLFAFDPRRSAILLLGGDKSGCWEEWYVEAIPAADRLYDGHLNRLLEEGPTDGEQGLKSWKQEVRRASAEGRR
jgi:hypothetical protein